MLLDNDSARLRHMLEASKDALMFSAGRCRQDLDRDRQLVFALVRALEIVGEAAARLSDEFRRAHPELPVHKMVAARNRLIHAYFDVNLDIVWQTVAEELPQLVRMLELLPEIKQDDTPIL